METFQALVLPVAVACLSLALLLDGKAGYVLKLAGLILSGFAVLFVLLGV